MTRLVGVVHLRALPGTPRASEPLDAVIAAAVRDARALDAGGADAIIVENFNDVPFHAERVPPVTVAAMTLAALRVREAVRCEVGVNVLRNDAGAALAVALASGATFIRVNVHTGAMLTDQGIVTGRADETLRARRALGAEHVAIWADVLVKHAVPLGPLSIVDAARDAVERGLADAVIVTGGATGSPASAEDLHAVSTAIAAPVYAGSGVTAENVVDLAPRVAGVIVGTALKAGGAIGNPVDPARVRALRDALDALDARRGR